MPAQRAERKEEPVKAVGPCNFAFWRILETYEAGTQVHEVTE